MIHRRTFVAGMAAVVVAPVAAEAQQAGRLPTIGLISNGKPTPVNPQLEAFHRGLRERGWIVGQNVAIEHRWAEGNPDALPTLASELTRLKVDVLMVSGSPAIRAARKATNVIPIVFVLLSDPVTAGFVQSLARPGGNMTGLASEFDELIMKQLQLLKEALPNVSRVVLLYHPGITPSLPLAAESAALRLGLTARSFKVATVAEFESVFKMAYSDRTAVHVLPSPFFATQSHRRQLIELAAKYRLPAVYEFSLYVDDGGLMSYGPSIVAMYGGMAKYVDLILKGTKPGDLPIERPAKFDLVINLKTAKALNLTIPPSLLLRADQVIE